METSNTKYGLLKDIIFPEYFNNGLLKRCILKQKILLRFLTEHSFRNTRMTGKEKSS